MKGATRLAAIDETARRLGLVPGLTLADARAQVPDLETEEHDPDGDRRWLERLCDGCARYTPIAAAAPPDALILDITGCTHLFGGEAALAADAAARLERLGIRTRCARAATAEAALALARYGDGAERDEQGAIRRLPVAALGLEAESALGLRRAGLKTVGAVADRPRAAIAARFGGAAATALARLLGEERGPLAPRLPFGMIQAGRRFPEPVARTDYALDILGELAREIEQMLRERGRGGRRFTAVFFRSDGLAQRLDIEFGRPVRDPEAVMRLFRERIDSLGDPLDPGFGFDAIRLSVQGEEELAPSQPDFDGDEAEDSAVEMLIDRLSIRLGRQAVIRCIPYDSHIPERRQRRVPAMVRKTGEGWSAGPPGEPPARPLELLDPPEPVSVIAEVPDGPPYRFDWRGKPHRVTRYEGPERIASEWWTRACDPLGETRLTRDYYRIEDETGRRYWLFRHGLYGREKADPGWYMHGLFA